MKKLLVLMCLAAAPVMSHANLSNCTNVYVGQIWVEKGTGLMAVVLLDSPTDGGGSYWSYFAGWSADELKSALAMLTAAKLSQHRVNVVTTEANGCNITVGGTTMKSVYLSTNP
jgi:hypothetical protein